MISVVIPTFDERAWIGRGIASIRADCPDAEIIVADGGSRDGTAALAAGLADNLVTAPRGRASQLNAGAAAAAPGSDVLLFLHADAILPPGALTAVREALAVPSVVGGAFRLRVDSRQPSLRVVSWAVNLRSRVLRLPYGDQALFVRRREFEALGGFESLPIMEDVDFVRRLRRRGRLALLRAAVRTSDRRWRANGVLRTTCVNWVAVALFSLSVDPYRIRALYDGLLASGRAAVQGPS